MSPPNSGMSIRGNMKAGVEPYDAPEYFNRRA